MAFPATPLDLLVEMQIDNLWWNVTEDVRVSDDVMISRGKADEAGQVSPALCTMKLNNSHGKYSPRNPVGPWYGKLGRNNQIRVGVQVDPLFDAFSSSSGTGDMSFTHTPVGAPTGVLVMLWESNNTGGGTQSVTYGGKLMTRISYGLFLLGSLNVVGSLYWLNTEIPTGPQTVVVDTNFATARQVSVQTLTGGTNCEIDVLSTAYSNVTPSANPRKDMFVFKRSWLFGSLFSDLDDGSGISPIAGWVQTSETDIGTETVNTIRSNIVQAPDTYSYMWTAPSAHWGIMAVAVRAIQYRFWGEVSAFPRRWDPTNTDVWVTIECSTLLRRLGQGRDPADPSLRSFLMSAQKLTRYWPLSGRKGTAYSLDVAPHWVRPTNRRFYAESIAGPVSSQFTYGEDMGSETIGTGMALFNSNNGPMRADVTIAYANHCVDFVWQTERLGQLYVIMLDYSGYSWMVSLDGVTGTAQVSVIDPNSGPIGFLSVAGIYALRDNGLHHFRLEWSYNIPNTGFGLYIDGQLISSGSYPFEWNSFYLIRFDYTRPTADYSWVNLAHLAVFSSSTPGGWPTPADTYQAFQAYAGERAGERIRRIAALGGYAVQYEGDPDDTVVMGPQFSEEMLSQLRDAEAADMGILAEPRDQLALYYRTSRSLTNQDALVTLDYDAGEVMAPFEPVEDDQLTRNDVTASQRDGGSWRYQKNTGPLNVQEPPLGVGRYKDEVTVNVNTVEQAGEAAGWLVHRGTLDLERFPSVTVDLARIARDGKLALVNQLVRLDLGDRIVVNNVPGIYGPVALLVLGYTEHMSTFKWRITLNCVPAETYEVYEVADPDSRISAEDSSTLAAGVTASATTLSVTSADGTLWTTSAGDMPISLMIGGEQMTVTAIAGAAVPQTFTVTRAVNGVSKSHSSGAPVRLMREAVWSL